MSNPTPTLFDMISCLSTAMDLVSPRVMSHQKRTAYIALRLGRAVGLTPRDQAALMLGGMLHDCGAMSFKTKLEALRFDFDLENPHKHAEVGYVFLRQFETLFKELSAMEMSTMVRYHHVSWNKGEGCQWGGCEVPRASHILHLADRVEVLVQRDREVLGQVEGIRDRIGRDSGRLFMPELVEAFEEVAASEAFWLDLMHQQSMDEAMVEGLEQAPTLKLDLEALLKLSRIMGQMVDFRSRFTAIHSSGVSGVAVALADMCGFSEREQKMIGVAGHLHDIGKLAVPTEILEKPGPLSVAEFHTVKAHPYHAWRLLTPLKPLGDVVEWASRHHETLDGTGYPFHADDQSLSLGCRILAVADIYTALAEDRPYRRGMPMAEALAILDDMVKAGKQDGLVVRQLADNCGDIDDLRIASQERAGLDYREMEAYI